MSTGDLATVIGGIAATLAVWKAILEAVRWFRRRRARHSLKRELLRLGDFDRQLREAVTELDYRLAKGTGWAGWAIWPDSLGSRLEELWRMTSELAHMRARIRAQWAEGPIERLRDDVEQLASLLRRATDLYMQGTIEQYRSSEGKPLGRSVTGRDPTVTLSDEEAREEVNELRRNAQLLLRSCAYQLGLKDMAERDDVALLATTRTGSLGATRAIFNVLPNNSDDSLHA